MNYNFESTPNFFADYGKQATVGVVTAQVILSQPGEDLMGGTIASNQYSMIYVTTALALAHGTVITVDGKSFVVLQTYLMDDGTFSRARLET